MSTAPFIMLSFADERLPGSINDHEVTHPFDLVNKRSKRAYVDDCLKQPLIVAGGRLEQDANLPMGMAHLVFALQQSDITKSTRYRYGCETDSGVWKETLVPLSLIHGLNRLGIQQRAYFDRAQRDGTTRPTGFQAFCYVRYMALLLEIIVRDIKAASLSGSLSPTWQSPHLNRWLLRHFAQYGHTYDERLRFDTEIGAGWYGKVDAARNLGL
jgi:hypothetical protein